MEAEFNFFQQWYPISPLEDIDPNKPTPVQLLGKRLVIWKPNSSENYRVFLDLCPHRLAPLSEGRVDETSGNLMCSYHGWEFDEDGICQRIPQAENSELVEKNKDNFCAAAFPTREANDLLWVWADPKSKELAEKTPLPLSPQIDASKGFVWSSFVRDMEYDWQTFIENVADPSHVPFAHHGVQGNRKRGQPLAIEVTESNRDFIEAKIRRGLATTITFEPPCRLEYAVSFGEKKQLGLITYCVPVSPGKSRVVAQFARNFAIKSHRIIPRWWNHVKVRNLVLDGDMVFLHQQERFLQEKQKSESWKTAYKLPTSADRLVIEFRRWFDKYCDGKLPWTEVGITDAKMPPINENRREILDRYHQHTQHCSSCRGAWTNIQRLEVFLLGYFAVAVAAAAGMPASMRSPFSFILVISGLLGLAVYAGLKFWLEPQFYFIDYVHAEKK